MPAISTLKSLARRMFTRPTGVPRARTGPQFRFEQFEDRVVPSATIFTELPDYQPGQTIQMTGQGFAAGETIQLSLGLNGMTEVARWQVTDGGFGDLDGVVDGSFVTTQLCRNWEDSLLFLTATGLTSQSSATHLFTDFGQGTPPNIKSQIGWDDIEEGPLQTGPNTWVYTAPAGQTINKVALKAGDNANFVIENLTGVPGDANLSDKHSPVIIQNGYLGNGNPFSTTPPASGPSYYVSGLGTSTITVTIVNQPSGSGKLSALSHLDVYLPSDTPTGQIRGFKYEDILGNGLKDGNDAFLSGWTIQLDNDNDPTNGVITTTVTNDDGSFNFSNLAPGNYYVREVLQEGWTQTDGGPLAFDSYEVTVVAGMSADGSNFGNFKDVVINGGYWGAKYHDLNGDGDRQENELGLNGWTIELYKESNGTAGFQIGAGGDTLIDSTVTANFESEVGLYKLDASGPGQYYIREVLQEGWTQTAPANNGVHTFIVESSGQAIIADFDFGNFKNVTIRGAKFYDANADGDKDGAGEPAIARWQVGIDVDGDNVADYFTLTGSDGSYVFGDLDNADGDNNPLTGSDLGPNATFTIIEGTQPNWVATTATSFTVTVGGSGVQSGGESTGNDFGNVKLGATGGKTIGFWSNKNGQAVFNTNTSGNLAGLVALNLRKADGSDFDPAGYAQFRTWLLSATATNMSYMLSAQYAGAWLNVNALGVSEDTIIHVGTLSLWTGNVQGAALVTNLGTLVSPTGFVRLGDVMAAANTLLGTNGSILAGDPLRPYAEALKVVLDGFNNNLSIAVAGLTGWTDDGDGIMESGEFGTWTW